MAKRVVGKVIKKGTKKKKDIVLERYLKKMASTLISSKEELVKLIEYVRSKTRIAV